MFPGVACARKRTQWLLLAVISLAPGWDAHSQAPGEKNNLAGPPRSGTEDITRKSDPAEDESRAWQKLLELSPNDPRTLIKGLEDFLARFPQSPRREQVLRTIYQQALQSNDPRKAIEAGEKLLALNPEDPDLLTGLTDLYGRSSDAASRTKALTYATRFVEHAEKFAAQSPSAEIPAGKWSELESAIRATAYFLRGKVHAESGEVELAVADFEKSLAIYPTADVAERLGDVSLQGGDTDRAIDAYATAFVIPDKRADPARRELIRRKLGSAYIAKYRSEKGLGELILARYDKLALSLAGRVRADSKADKLSRDPSEFILQRLDGSELHLRELKGKVVVMDFWATWCAPCRLQGKLIEQVVESFRQEPAVTFLAVNTDEDRSGVPKFLKEENWTTPVVYGPGLEQLLGIRALPTVLILDREGRVAYRQAGLDPGSFVPVLQGKIREALEMN
ncbi:MAG: redoxin family protein [Terriglobia bacterium]